MRRWSNGFTLIELLVVIAIIAILAAILMPVFAQAREKARMASCASNMRNLTMATVQYVQDYDEKLPFWSWWHSFGGGPGDDGVTDRSIWYNAIFPYVKNTQVYTCPSDTLEWTTARTDMWWWGIPASARNPTFENVAISYGFGETLHALNQDWNGPSRAAGANLAQINRPAETFLLGDAVAALADFWGQCLTPDDPNASSCNVATRVAFANGVNDGCAWAHSPDPMGSRGPCGRFDNNSRHHGGANIGFADGHVKFLKPNRIREFYMLP